MANPTLQQVLSTQSAITALSGANLQNIASGSGILGTSAFSNVVGDAAGQGFPWALAHLHLSSMAVSSGGYAEIWFLPASDGSTYSQGSASAFPVQLEWYKVFAPIAQTAVVDLIGVVRLPICALIKCLFKGTLGASTPNDTNGYLKLYPFTDSYPSL